MEGNIRQIEGMLDARGLKIALVASRFNDFVVSKLIDGAIDYLLRHSLEMENIVLVRVPGAFEIPLVCEKLAKSKKYDGIVSLGAVIRGATPHFEYISAETVKGIAHVSLHSEIPVGFGILTCDTIEQAIERAGAKAGNKGAEAAGAMLETINILKQIA